ncbi:MAG: DUF2357 domain-containing protein [Clostridia bacterium]|nr:DUF2357 domain-containing protein [Clostridia bacterium]
MDKLDIYYRALTDSRKHTREDNDCARRRKSISRADTDLDVIEVVRTECEIEDDWVNAIEEGLEHIGKAIAEERQFILSNGEVVPIEKVKNVSRESVEHLAKHSNLLTKEPEEGKDLVPDELYTVERLTDFAVYENRFLYMLLCYLKEFISVRYDAITELTTTYVGKMAMKKNVSTGNRQVVYEVLLDEKVRNDEFLRNNNPSKAKIDKIDGLLKAVVSYLATPLMDEVAKAPMLKPPITETNVLKMNRNFKGAMQLYYFITAYTKKGYSYTSKTHKLSPFKEDVADELAETVELSSFLTYEYGMGIQGKLKENYEEQLRIEKKQAEQRKLEQIKSLRKRINELGESPEEYMILLEQRNGDLEAECRQLAAVRAQIEELKVVVEKKNADIAALNGSINSLNIRLEEKDIEIAAIKEEHAAEIERLEQSFEDDLAARDKLHAENVAAINGSWQQKIDAQKQESEKIKKDCDRQLAEGSAKVQEIAEKQKITEEKLLHANARLNAIKQQSGIFDGDEDYTSRGGFDELEREYEYLRALFRKEWRKTKKGIRKKYLKVNARGDDEAVTEDNVTQDITAETTEENSAAEEQALTDTVAAESTAQEAAADSATAEAVVKDKADESEKTETAGIDGNNDEDE